MANQPTTFNLDDPDTVLKWESTLMVEVAKRTAFLNPRYGLIGDSDTSLVQRKKELFGGQGGSKGRIMLTRQFRQLPTYGNQTLRDREEGLTTAPFDFEINQLRHATALVGQRISKQRVPWDAWKTSLRQMGEYWPQVTEAGLMMHAAGITTDIHTAREWYHVGTHLGATLGNTPTAPDANHIIRVHDHATDELVGADTSAILDTNTSSRLVAMAKTLPIPIRPAMIHGQELYVLFVHPYQVAHLKDNSRWLSRMKDTIKGGAINGNPLWTGSLGIDDGVLWIECQFVPTGVNSSTGARVANARRSIFCGAQSLVIGLAKDYEDESTFKNDVETWDYANNKGVAATILMGAAKPRFEVKEQSTTDDYATIVCTSYAKELVTSA